MNIALQKNPLVWSALSVYPFLHKQENIIKAQSFAISLPQTIQYLDPSCCSNTAVFNSKNMLWSVHCRQHIQWENCGVFMHTEVGEAAMRSHCCPLACVRSLNAGCPSVVTDQVVIKLGVAVCPCWWIINEQFLMYWNFCVFFWNVYSVASCFASLFWFEILVYFEYQPFSPIP